MISAKLFFCNLLVFLFALLKTYHFMFYACVYICIYIFNTIFIVYLSFSRVICILVVTL